MSTQRDRIDLAFDKIADVVEGELLDKIPGITNEDVLFALIKFLSGLHTSMIAPALRKYVNGEMDEEGTDPFETTK